MFGKIAVVTLLVLIVTSLFSALRFMYKGGGKGEHMARALTIRVGLSIALFALLMAGYYFDILVPHSLYQ